MPASQTAPSLQIKGAGHPRGPELATVECWARYYGGWQQCRGGGQVRCHCETVHSPIQWWPWGVAATGANWGDALVCSNGPGIICQGWGRRQSWRHIAPINFDTKYTASSTQRRAYSTKYTASSTQHQACSVEHIASSMQHQVYSIEHTAPSIQHQVYSIEHTASSTQHQVYSIERTASSIQHQVCSIEHAASSIQHQVYLALLG